MGGFGHASLIELDFSDPTPAAPPPAPPRMRTLPARDDPADPAPPRIHNLPARGDLDLQSMISDLAAGAPPADPGAAESTDAWWNAPSARQILDHGLPAPYETMSPEDRYQADLMTHVEREPAIADGAVERTIQGAAETALSLLPGSGEAMSLEDYFDSMAAADRAEGWAKVPHYAGAATALIGAVPLLGAVARGARKAGQGAGSLIDAVTHADDAVPQLSRGTGIGDDVAEAVAEHPVPGNSPNVLDSRFAGGRIENVPDRPIEADYLHGVPADDAGRLTYDIDGRPLSAPYVAGRTGAAGVDAALQPEDVFASSEGLFGTNPMGIARSRIPGGAAGAYIVRAGDDGPVRQIVYDRTLSPEQAENVIAHEFAHGVNELAGGREGIPLSRPLNDYSVIYHMQNDPTWRRTNPETRPGLRTTPETFRYRRHEVRGEQMAEAIRLYMQNPAYMKEHFPNVARRIREYVNTNPRLNHTIQFNEFGAPLGVAGLGASGFAQRGREDEDEDQVNEFDAPLGVAGLGMSGLAPRGRDPEEEDEDERSAWGWR